MIRKQRIFFLLWVLLSGLLPQQLSGQSDVDIDSLQLVLTDQIQHGNWRALRDMATFLDKPDYANRTRGVLLHHTFFTPSELDVAHATREQCLSFLYDKRNQLKFSDVLKAFYLTPIENQTATINLKRSETTETNPSVYFRILTNQFDSLVSKKQETYHCQKLIKKIAALETPESYDWLRRTLTLLPFGKNAIETNLALCEALANEPSAENLKAVLTAMEQGFVPESLLSVVCLQLTNYTTSPRHARFLLDSLGSSELLRTAGYERMYDTRLNFFYEKVDYFAKIFLQDEAPEWLQNSARFDMLSTRTPRLLFYLAAQMYLKPEQTAYYVHYLNRLTKVDCRNAMSSHLSSSDATSDAIHRISTIEKQKDILRWWASHAEDFEWDESEHRFVSKAEATARAEELERQVRRLGSSNDSVAFAAFVHLTEGDPPTVVAMVERFRPILRAYNAHLPPLNYTYLEQMTALSAYCRKHGFSLRLPPHLTILMDSLRQIISEQKRYKIENQILEQINITNISAIEFYGLLYSVNVDWGFSIGRIIDIFYSKNWKQVIDNDAQLRLYLKKSALFKNIGVAGVSSMYDKKFDRRDEYVRLRLTHIARSESDGDIQDNVQDWRTTASLAQKVEDSGRVVGNTYDEASSDESIESRLRRLQVDGTFSIADLNAIVAASKFSEAHRPLVIKLLKKISPLSTIRSFKLKNWFKVSRDLVAFADLEIGAKDLDDVIRVFEIDDDAAIWAFIEAQTAVYSLAEKATFWNAMFKVSWFNNVLYDNLLKPARRDSVLGVLRKYLTPTDEVLSEFEEQMTLVHIAELENMGKTLTEKLEATLALDAPDVMKMAVQSAILARLNYADIGTAVRYAYRYTRQEEGSSLMSFLTTDFGLPFFAYTKEEWAQFIENHAIMSKMDFYIFYLKRFGVVFQTADGKLDYAKIYEILRFDAVQPFTTGGAPRNFFTFGIIKLLEFEFKTTLGFHEKLNENQFFYINTTTKRAVEWRTFLITNKLVSVNSDGAIGFNEN
ncbi:MAG: hypothetical protein U5L45_16870 [Saprospiraceae bacterium]|nr:hypothetical protein [Saprospiraceae bacterium]